MTRKRYEVEPIGEAHDTLTEVSLEVTIQNVLRHGQLDQSRTHIVYEEYSIGRMGAVWHRGSQIGQVEGWGRDERKRYGLV